MECGLGCDDFLSPDLTLPPLTPQVGEGVECGLGCDDFLDWAEGDKLDVYLLVSKARRLEEAKATTAVDVASLTA